MAKDQLFVICLPYVKNLCALTAPFRWFYSSVSLGQKSETVDKQTNDPRKPKKYEKNFITTGPASLDIVLNRKSSLLLFKDAHLHQKNPILKTYFILSNKRAAW